MYTNPLGADQARRLPGNLLDALRALGADHAMAEALGPAFVRSYLKLKEQEWAEHQAQLSPWERQTTLDC